PQCEVFRRDPLAEVPRVHVCKAPVMTESPQQLESDLHLLRPRDGPHHGRDGHRSGRRIQRSPAAEVAQLRARRGGSGGSGGARANSAGGTNTINVPAGKYSLTLTPSGPDDGTTGDLHITADVTIAGAGAGATTISGNTGGGAPNNCTVDPSGSLSPQGHNVE